MLAFKGQFQPLKTPLCKHFRGSFCRRSEADVTLDHPSVDADGFVEVTPWATAFFVIPTHIMVALRILDFPYLGRRFC